MVRKSSRNFRSKLASFFYTSVIGGLAVFLPIYLTLLFVNAIAKNILNIFKPLISRLSSFLPFDYEITNKILAFILLILLCFIGGVISRTALGSIVQKSITPKLEKLPGYHLLQSVTHQITGSGNKEELRVAIVALGALDESLSVGFLIAQHKNGDYTVFVPSVPAPAAGAMYIVPKNKVFPVDIPFITAIKFYSQFGEGSDEFLEAISQYRMSQKQNPGTITSLS